MKVAGIIAEYNPFHNGHLYQLNALRAAESPDYVIIAMAGDFLQRGTPALMDKYARTRMALLQGADLVLELPACFATASAEGFARGGISLLLTTGLVDILCFGAECGSLERLLSLSRLLAEEPEWYRKSLNCNLKKGLSFPAASASSLPNDGDLLCSPNNILALEYLKAIHRLHAPLRPVLIPRKGSGYHDFGLDGPLASASAIRKSLLESGRQKLAGCLPPASFQIIRAYETDAAFLTEDDFSLLLHQRLLEETAETMNGYMDFTPSLANRILNARSGFLSWTRFCESLHSKDTTYARISRLFTHLLLRLQKEPWEACLGEKTLPYLRILGFRKEAEPLLSRLKKTAAAPLLPGLSGAKERLNHEGLWMLGADLYAADLYRCVLTAKTGRSYPNEYRRKMLVEDMALLESSADPGTF